MNPRVMANRYFACVQGRFPERRPRKNLSCGGERTDRNGERDALLNISPSTVRGRILPDDNNSYLSTRAKAKRMI